VVIFNFSIKAQVGRLMVAICSFGCVSTVDLTSDCGGSDAAPAAAKSARLAGAREPAGPQLDGDVEFLLAAPGGPFLGRILKSVDWHCR
jgi:hypothetical protein